MRLSIVRNRTDPCLYLVTLFFKSRIPRRTFVFVFVSLFFMVGSVASLTCRADNPSVDLKQGAKLYKRLCKGCHGADGRGGAHTFMPHVAKLTEKGYIDKIPDEYLMLAIKKGGTAVGKSSYMPAWESTLSDQDVTNIIAHIRSLPSY